jgi:hypothetical protein
MYGPVMLPIDGEEGNPLALDGRLTRESVYR